jgi:hypothetical protein
MKTLKELVLYQQMTGEDDLTLIKMWFYENDMEMEGISIITELAESKIDKLQLILNKSRTWIPYLPDLSECNKSLTKEQVQNIQSIIQMYLLGMDLKESNLYKWAKEEIPKIELPRVMFVPCIEWLDKTYRIRFKELSNEKE